MRENGLDGVIRSAIGEIAQKRIAGSQRKKSKRGAPCGERSGEQAVDDLKSRAVASHGNKIAEAARRKPRAKIA